jgi:hypothetical protein
VSGGKLDFSAFSSLNLQFVTAKVPFPSPPQQSQGISIGEHTAQQQQQQQQQ